MLAKTERNVSIVVMLVQFTHVLDFVVLMPLGQILMRKLGITTLEFATLVSSYNISAAFVGLVAGVWIDRIERKKFLLVCYAGFIAATLMCGLSSTFTVFLIARIIAGAFGGLTNSAVYSIIGDYVNPHGRGEATGIVMSSFSIASVAGVPLGLHLANLYNWEMTFFFIVGLSLLIFLLCLVYLPKIEVVKEGKTSLNKTFKNYTRIAFSAKAFWGLALMATVSCSSFVIIPFISPFVVGNLGFSETDLKYIYLFGGIATLASSRLVGRWCDRWGANRIYIIFSLLACIPGIVFTNLNHSSMAFTLVITSMFMVLFSSRFIPVLTLMNSIPSNTDRGAFLTLSNSTRTFAVAFASWIGGYIVSHDLTSNKLVGYNISGWVSVALTVLSILILRQLNKNYKLI